MRPLVIASAIALFASAGLAHASEALPTNVASQLDRLPVAFAMSAAKERRLMIIDETLRQQQEQRRGPQPGRGGYGDGYSPRGQDGYGPPPGYGRPRGYGPPPYGYAPPPPPPAPRYDYGPPPPYGYDYSPPPPW